MRIERAVTHGIFCYEVKNRFRCIVQIDGNEKICYVASSSRLTNFIDLAGKDVLLLPKGKSASSTEYTLFAVKTLDGNTLLELSLANAAIAEQLYRRSFCFLGKRKNIFREKNIDGYKTDLYVADTDTLIEIKTVISDNKIASFPTVNSDRALEQLIKILILIERGRNICYLFAVLSPNVKRLEIDRSTDFYGVFQKCIAAGMMCRACKLKTTSTEISVEGLVEII